MSKRYTIFALFAVILIDALGWGIAFPVLAPILLNNTSGMLDPATSLAMRNFLYELTLGIYCLFMFLMAPTLGSFSDKYGRKTVLMVSMFGNCVGFLLSGFAITLHSFALLLIGRSIAGATAGSLPIAQAAMVDISSDAEKASRLGLIVLANISGFVIGPVIGGFFLDPTIFGQHVIYSIPFLLSGTMGLIGALLIIFCFQETFQGDRSIHIHFWTSFLNIGEAFTNLKTKTLCWVLLLFLFGWGMFFSTVPVLLTERLGWHGGLLGYFITYIAVIFFIVTLFVMPRVNNRFQLSHTVLTGLSAMILASILFPMIHNAIAPWFIIALAIAIPFTYVGIITMMSNQVDAQKQGQLMGVAGSIFAFTWGVGPILAGFSLKFGLTAPYCLSAIFFLAALVLTQKKNVPQQS